MRCLGKFTGFPDFTYSHFVSGGCLSALSLLEGEDRTEVRLPGLHPPYIRARGQHRRGPRSRSPDFLHVPLALEEPESRLSPRSRSRDPRLQAERGLYSHGRTGTGLYSHGREPVQPRLGRASHGQALQVAKGRTLYISHRGGLYTLNYFASER